MQLLTLSEAAVMLRASEGIAKKILANAPCVDYGRGRGRGKRWLKEDIEAVIKKMHGEKETTACQPASQPASRLSELKPSDLYSLTQPHVLQ